MPILGELLQYNKDFRETTLKKAEAVERLCGVWALPYPTRLIAAEVAMAAQCLGLSTTSKEISVLSSDRYWHPNIEDVFDDLGAQIRQSWDAEIAALGSRALRRRAARQLHKLDFLKVASAAAPEIAAKHGLPPQAIVHALVPFLRGAITSAEASRCLFAYFAEPVSFVKIYFERPGTDATLPQWIDKLSKEVQRSLVEFQYKIRSLGEMKITTEEVDNLYLDTARRQGQKIVRSAINDADEFGIDRTLFERFATEPLLFAEVPAGEIAGAVLKSHLVKIVGQRMQAQANIDGSSGGDLFHAMYLPHVDLWRGDKKFSQLIQSAVPRYADRVVPLLTDLPARIDAWWTATSRRFI